jgi:myo-inositol-1(or 4)-monophosphatase
LQKLQKSSDEAREFMHVTQQDADTVIAVALDAAGLVQRMRRSGGLEVHAKSSEIDLVTAADLACEQFVREALSARYPGVGLLGEESNQAPAEDFFWVVDPIDGTTNFANNLPHCAVNIALQHHAETLLGVTVHLATDWVYYARRGAGAFFREPNGHETRLHVNRVNQLRRALLVTGFPYTRGQLPDDNVAEFAHFVRGASDVRVLGSAALDLAFVASGIAAASWEFNLNPWDVAPGALIVREAGGIVTDYDGAPWTLYGRRVVASNGQPALHDALLSGIRVARQASLGAS